MFVVSPIYRLPPYTVQQVLRASELSETIDWGLAQLGVPDVWRETEGQGVTVGIVDTGADFDHPDLAGAFVASKDFSRSAFGPSDHVGHGTHCAGIVAARENGRGVVGVAPQSKLLIAKGLGNDGSGASPDIADAIDWCVEQGADLISMSLGAPMSDAGILAAIRRAVAAEKFVITAAGNDGRANSVNYPARYPETIAVAATGRDGRAAPYSSRGSQVDIAAPGSDILSTYLNESYARLSGTSMATPFVSGCVALMLAHAKKYPETEPRRTVDWLRNRLRDTAKDEGPVGHDPQFGWGLIDPAKLVDAGEESAEPVPLEPAEATADVVLPATLNGVAGAFRGTLVFAAAE